MSEEIEIKWHTERRKLGDLKELENNPRTITTEAYNSLKRQLAIGNFKPLIADLDGVILGGNQKYKILLEKYGADYEVEVSVPERKLTSSERGDVVILDNQHSGEDDLAKIAEDYANSWNKFGFESLDDLANASGGGGESIYTAKVITPVYEPVNEKPDISSLVDCNKANDLYEKIDSSDIPDDIKGFLKIACTRFYTFDYSKIADYYANSDKEVQDLMEKLALVIIDYDKAIENGFLDFVKNILDKRKEEYGK